MFENIVEDIRMYDFKSKNIGTAKKILYLLTTQELHAVLIYRFGHWAEYQCKIPVIAVICRTTYFILRKISELFFGIGIWPESIIGPGFKIEHWGGVIVVAKKIGRNCRVSHQVTIGHIGGFKGGGAPIIGDNVYIGAGAKVLGDIIVGNNVKIGANAVVLRDVPDNATAVGVPAKFIYPHCDDKCNAKQ
jgi:serine O-acetyltransferase